MWAQTNFEASSFNLWALYNLSSMQRQKSWLSQSLQAL